MTTTTTRRPAGSHRGKPAARRAARDRGRLPAALAAIGTVLASAFAALTMVIAIASHLSARDEVSAFGHPLLTVLSGSMSPVIKTGDLIVDDQVSPAQARHLRPGQIISFLAAPGSTVVITHRIVAREVVHGAVEYTTKGDANNAPDTSLRPATDVVGLYVGSIRGGGYVLTALHRPLVPILLAISIALCFLAGPLFRLARQMDEREASSTH
jgi:signal peptidase I